MPFSHAPTCSSPLTCNTRREGRANVQALPSSRGNPGETVKFEPCGGAKTRTNLGESLNVCVSTQIPLQQINLSFITVYTINVTGYVLIGFFADFASVGLKTHEIGSVAKRNDIVVHLLGSLTQGLCLNPVQLSKGHHMPLSGCGSWVSSPA